MTLIRTSHGNSLIITHTRAVNGTEKNYYFMLIIRKLRNSNMPIALELCIFKSKYYANKFKGPKGIEIPSSVMIHKPERGHCQKNPLKATI